MEKITIHDKQFRIFKTAAQLDEAIDNVATQINEDLKNVDFPIFLGILNGSFMFISDLMKKIRIDGEVMFVKLASYEGTSSTGKVKQVLGLNKDITGRTVVIVEDIIETGNTIVELRKILEEAGAAQVKICTLLFKPQIYDKQMTIDYTALRIPNEFVVGYGLDYNSRGRQYKDLYILDNE